MQYTTNYNLNKPEATDAVDISKINDNTDTLDTTVKAVDTKIGSQTYTEQNYATDGASDTANIDALDMAVKDNADLISTMQSEKIYAYDSFNRADGAIGSAESGQVWVRIGNGTTFNISSNAVSTGDVTYGAMVIPFRADGIVSIKMPVVGMDKGLCARMTDMNNCIRIMNSAGTWKLYKRVASTSTELASLGAAANGDIIKLRMAGTQIKAYVNGVLKATVAITDLTTAVNCGMLNASSAASSATRWDDISMEVL